MSDKPPPKIPGMPKVPDTRYSNQKNPQSSSSSNITKLSSGSEVTKSLKRKLHEMDFSSESIVFHLMNLSPPNIYRFPKDNFDYAIPNFSKIFPPSPDGIYRMNRIDSKDFEAILHWVAYGQMKEATGVDLVTDRNEENVMVSFRSFNSILRLYDLAESFEVPELQNLLIQSAIDRYMITKGSAPWRSINDYFAKKSDFTFGMGKLCLDLIIYSKVESLASTTWLTHWGNNHAIPKEFFVKLAIESVNKKDVPPFVSDPSQYYLP